MPVYLPLPVPEPEMKLENTTPLETSKQTLYDAVLTYFANPNYTIPNVEKGQLLELEKYWLSRECMLRYLRATKWKSAPAAIARLESTLMWRRDYGVYTTVNADFVEPEAVTGKEVIFGYDTNRRPALYMFPSRQNTQTSPRQIQYTVWLIERCIELMGKDVETLNLMINFADKAANPSIGTALSFVHILQNHYPERLGIAVLIKVPWLVNLFLTTVKKFLDPVTAAKIQGKQVIFKHKKDKRTYIMPSPEIFDGADPMFTKNMVLQDGWDGDEEFIWDHAQYWPALVKMCADNQSRWFETWKTLGGVVGLSEADYKVEHPHE